MIGWLWTLDNVYSPIDYVLRQIWALLGSRWDRTGTGTQHALAGATRTWPGFRS